jgi:hypothetical protein
MPIVVPEWGGGLCSIGRRPAQVSGVMDTKKLLLVLMLGLAVAGCASDDNLEAQTANDPLEPMNRFFFDFN